MSSRSQAYLAIDGGGSQTRAAIIDSEGNTIAIAKSGPSNPNNIGFEQAAANINEAVTHCLNDDSRSHPSSPFRYGFLGIAGIATPESQDNLRKSLAQFPWGQASNIEISHDLAIALEGSLEGQAGICLVAGTGSACYGKDANGNSARSSGRDQDRDDPGSGYAIGRQAIERDLFETRVSLGDDRSTVAALFSRVVECAQLGNALALDILTRQSRQLSLLAVEVHRRLELRDKPKIVLTGGTLENCSYYRKIVSDALQFEIPSAVIRQAKHSPLSGAAMLALKNGGVQLSNTVLKNLS